MNWRKREAHFCMYNKYARKRKHAHARAHTHTPNPGILVTGKTPPTPTFTQQDIKSIVILCIPGAAWKSWLTSMLFQHVTDGPWHLRSLYSKRNMFIHSPFLLREYRPQNKPFPVCISYWHTLSEFPFGMQPRGWKGEGGRAGNGLP